MKRVFGALLLSAVAVVVYLTLRGGPAVDAPGFGRASGPIQTVTALVGGEKMRFLGNEDVQRILRERHRIELDATKAGSIEMVTILPTAGKDCLWPSNQVAVEIFRRGGGSPLAEETIFNSPLVLYTWDVVADALAAEGWIAERGGAYYVGDFPAMIDKVVAGTGWSEVGLSQLFGNMKIFSTDPRRSNSGNMFAGLLVNMMNGGEVVTAERLPSLEPQLIDYFRRMGFMEHSSGDIFENFLKTGVGAKPIIVGYENQLIEFALEHEEHQDLLRRRIRTLYPVPTVWSSHPIIALEPACRDLIQALQDPELQQLAWERHGFRSGLMDVENDPDALPVAGVPRSIDAVVPMPSAAVMERIVDAL